MAAAAGREVGEQAEIELLARGMRYAGRESLHYCLPDKSKRNITASRAADNRRLGKDSHTPGVPARPLVLLY